MSKVLKEMNVIVGKYTNANGQEKNRYMKIGAIIATKNGDRAKLDVYPIVPGGWDGWIYLNEPRTDKPVSKVVDFDDDIGF